MIISLDVATTTGFCFGPVGAQPPLLQWGSRRFNGGNGEIVATFRAWLNQLCYTQRPTLCVFETPYVPVPRGFPKPGKSGPPPMNPLVLRRLLAMTGTIEAICFEMRIECREAVSSAFTKFVTGKGQYPGGRAEKKAAVINACGVLGLDTADDDDAADALALWLFAEGMISPRASEARSRLAADRDRELHGSGPLFPPERANAPRGQTRGALETMTDEESTWISQTTI